MVALFRRWSDIIWLSIIKFEIIRFEIVDAFMAFDLA